MRWLVVLFLSLPLWAVNTYYVAANGADTNNGTAKATPWLHAPGMTGCANTCASTTPAAGDSIIFKGGDTWNNANFPWVIKSSGTFINSVSTPIYYGVDATWFTGGAWTRPTFDFQAQVINDGGNNNAIDMHNAGFGRHDITFDNIHFTHYYWTSATLVFAKNLVFYGLDTSTYNITVKNCLMDNWSYLAGASDVATFWYGASAGPSQGTTLISSNMIDGSGASPTASNSMDFVKNADEVSGNTCHDVSNCFVGTTRKVHDNLMYNVNQSYTPAIQHANVIEAWLPATGVSPLLIYNNTIHDVQQGVFCLDENPSFARNGIGGNAYIYNNVSWNCHSTNGALMIDDSNQGGVTPDWSNTNHYVWNNTFMSPDNTIPSITIGRSAAITLGTVVIQNNHFITDRSDALYICKKPTSTCSDVTNYTNDTSNLKQTSAIATTAGYVVGNSFAPTLTSSPTVDLGTNTSPTVVTDVLGIARPQHLIYDIGAYEFAGFPAPFHGSVGCSGTDAGSRSFDTTTHKITGTCTAGVTACSSGALANNACTAAYNTHDADTVTFTATNLQGVTGSLTTNPAVFADITGDFSLVANYVVAPTITLTSDTAFCNPVNGCTPTLTATSGNCNVAGCVWECQDFSGSIITDTVTGFPAYCAYGSTVNALCGDGTHPSGAFSIHWKISDFSFNPYQTAQCTVFIPGVTGGQSVKPTVGFGAYIAPGKSWLQY